MNKVISGIMPMNKLTTPEKQPTQTTKTNFKPLVAEVQISGAWRKSGGILVMKLEGHWFKVDPQPSYSS